MIKINALFFLLLVELLVILAGAVVFLVLRGNKRALVYQEAKRELAQVRSAKEVLQKQLAGLKTGAPLQSKQVVEAAADTPAAFTKTLSKDYEDCKREITILEETVKEKTKLLLELQARYDGVEKEYLLLYQQQQQAQELNKS